MIKFEILGPNKLSGEIEVNGAKNAAMKMIAASILIDGDVILENVPDIADIQTIIDLLTDNGAKIHRKNHTLIINVESLTNQNPDPKKVSKMRGSIVLVGSYLARFGKIEIPQPGGDLIGARSIETHLDAFRKMNVNIENGGKNYKFTSGHFESGEIVLKEKSVTATENIILASVKAKGTVKISNAAIEPEILDLVNFLNIAGAKISVSQNTYTISGVKSLHTLNYKVMPDRIETGTFAALAVVTKSPLKIVNCRTKDLEIFWEKLSKMGVKFEKREDFLYIKSSSHLTSGSIETEVYPAFPTDLQSLMGLIFTQADGTSKIGENLYENRLNYLRELEKMGARINILNSHQAEITGPTILHGAKIASLDIRSGITLILAGLIAEGKTVISNAEIVDRGYEKIEERLQKIGAKIKRVG
ncbi:UDP-N-acetylglucosamine 1-carboxyvinyltransferase [Candidatus Berkelbacteria bacterium RBG_13_40_8]|uniref:UDP-N-acetylglucosamine 1-carboxyvinyltransferase n=1 Tax=Candidatus Berkelbacteria bacterium RBG_13_40_8 TaxID=1797467 RepID=A0A1F5DQJ0_9BACT|nr:MAG: UDP-N-acetylglucosamine 1-carboxyvinyltransferase [Candidatus Berkelbacteria bacterium RBG_13_40_8]